MNSMRFQLAAKFISIILACLTCLYTVPIMPVQAADDPFGIDVPGMREDFFKQMSEIEQKIINKYVEQSGVPWYDSADNVYTHHPNYKDAVRDYQKAWQQHMDGARGVDIRRPGMESVLKRAEEMAAKDGAKINWAEDFKPSGTNPWDGRGIYTDMEYTGTDQANKYVLKALREKNMSATATPGQNNITVKNWDMEIWGKEGAGPGHRMINAENPEYARSASPLKGNVPVDKQTAAYEALKKAHLEKADPRPGSFQEYQRLNDLAKAVERGEQNVLGKSHADKTIAELNDIRSMKKDPVTAGLRKLGDKEGLQSPQTLAMEKSLKSRLSNIMETGKQTNKTFINDMNKLISEAEGKGDIALANELKLYKNQTLQNQMFLHKSLYNKLGPEKFAGIMEGTEFELARDPDTGLTMVFRNTETGETLSKLDIMERYRNVIKKIEADQAAGISAKYRNRATGEWMKDSELLEQAKGILKKLEEGKYDAAVKLTEYEPMWQRGRTDPTRLRNIDPSKWEPYGTDRVRNLETGEVVSVDEYFFEPRVKKVEYEVVYEKGKGGQRMYRNKVTGETIPEAQFRKKYLEDPIAELRKQMSELSRKEASAAKVSGNLTFKSFDKTKVTPFKRRGLPKIKENIFKPRRVKNIRILKKYAEAARKVFEENYPELGSAPPENAYWIMDPREVVERFVRDAEEKMSSNPEILKAFRSAKREILRHHVRTQVQHTRDAYYMAQEEYIKAAKERSIIRARKMAREAEFNTDMKKLFITLFVTEKLMDFLQTWYDEGFAAFKYKVISFFYIEIPIMVAAEKAIGAFMAALTMNCPTLATIAGTVLGTAGASAVVMMVAAIGKSVTYMTVDYFILDDNRQTLIKSIYPQPPARVNPWDFWTWLKEERKIDIENNEKGLQPLVEFLESPESSWSTTLDDIELFSKQMVTMYRHWLLENYEYIRRLDYFQDDPKVWAVITNELTKLIWYTNKMMEFAFAQDEEARKQREFEDDLFAASEADLDPQWTGVMTGIKLNDTVLPDFLSTYNAWDIHDYRVKQPLEVKAGTDLKVKIDYVVMALPGEKVKVKITPHYEEGYPWYAFGDVPMVSGIPYEGEVTGDDDLGLAFGKAEISLPLQYPTQKGGNKGDNDYYESRIQLDMQVQNKNLYSAVIKNPIRVEGPGTDFNGRGNLTVRIKVDESSIQGKSITELPDVTITLEPLSGQKEIPKQVKGVPLKESTQYYQNIELGAWRAIAELEKKVVEKASSAPADKDVPSDAEWDPVTILGAILWGKKAYAAEYTGAGRGTKIVTMYMPKPLPADTPLEERHAGEFEAVIQLGKFDTKDFVTIKHRNPEIKNWNILVTVQDTNGKPITGATVKITGSMQRKAEEQRDGQYLLKDLPVVGKVGIRAEVDATMMKTIGTKKYHSSTEVTFNNSTQANATIVIGDFAQYKWMIQGKAIYDDGSPIKLQPGDEFSITMGGEEGYPKKVSGLSYSFGPFPVPPDSQADNPQLDQNRRSFKAEIKREGVVIALATRTILRQGYSSTEYNIEFSNALKNIIDPDSKKDPPKFTQTRPVAQPNPPPQNIFEPLPEPKPDKPKTGGGRSIGKAFLDGFQKGQADYYRDHPKPKPIHEPTRQPTPVPPTSPTTGEEGSDDCLDANGRPTIFCETFDEPLQNSGPVYQNQNVPPAVDPK